MSLTSQRRHSISDSDSVPICTPSTTLSTPPSDQPERQATSMRGTQASTSESTSPLISSSIPWPSFTFIIRSVPTGEVLTLLAGTVMLSRPGGRGSIHWVCDEQVGWLGFRNVVSGEYLGHNTEGDRDRTRDKELGCWSKRHGTWEDFCVRARPEGGFVLLVREEERLRYVGVVEREDGKEKVLMNVGRDKDKAAVWEFVKV